ncbi:hypothetical protein Phi40:1_gp028 [Cellulophaga phage phi40:1]|uniref:Uncharacterized protein n=1 Tax=Cellulophaga phage phi38:1 TaxID=1327977 RepID=S0A1I8_9CAUD|nr:hypothetical protein Phi38:1_gp028 [Cellulophaga phage phi38:1]AGO47893.1 hypothetical protein Phi40:1_gp028 [Cellulophaga phage phi40:1]AGO48058.1 hypothetical protein Phi38:1_gp028 [Cellulophaga phage phi38:1]
MNGSKYISSYRWFAWHPVKCIEGKWHWLKMITKEVDERPVVYLGLLPDIKYIDF